MKKTQGKDAVRNIRKRIVSYLSICLVIMLGLGGVFITRYMGAGINKEATGYFNDHNFKNYELISSLGITDEDLAQIKETEGITDAEGVIRTSGSLTRGDLNCNIELVSMTENGALDLVLTDKAFAAPSLTALPGMANMFPSFTGTSTLSLPSSFLKNTRMLRSSHPLAGAVTTVRDSPAIAF